MEMDTEHEELVIEDGNGEQNSVEGIPPEDDLSSHGTFDAETDSELSFNAPTPGEVPTSGRVLRPRKHVDYHRLENPEAFELFAILGSNTLEGSERLEPITRIGMKLAALKHEDDYDSKKKVSKWLIDQCKVAEPKSPRELTVEIVEDEPTAPFPEPEALEHYCVKVTLPSSKSRPNYSFFIKYYDMDFLTSSMPLVVAATAAFEMSSGLADALNREMSNADFPFSQ